MSFRIKKYGLEQPYILNTIKWIAIYIIVVTSIPLTKIIVWYKLVMSFVINKNSQKYPLMVRNIDKIIGLSKMKDLKV